MAGSPTDALLRHVYRLIETHAHDARTDAQLLQHFADGSDSTAFAALLHRHSRLVWSVCRHVLNREHDAEDAFQATFLVLARRATSIRKPQAVASWLYGVAHRIALRA